MRAHPQMPATRSLRYDPTRRTALILSGEGTSIAYLIGVVKALNSAGVRIDLVAGKGGAALPALFAAIRAVDRLEGSTDSLLERVGPSAFKLERHLRFAFYCLAASGAVFLAPALIMIVGGLLLPVVASIELVLPGPAASGGGGVAQWLVPAAQLAEPTYFRLLSFPLIALFGYLVWLSVRDWLRHRTILDRWLSRGVFDTSSFVSELERALWQAVRGPAPTEKPDSEDEIGRGFRQLLQVGLGQHGFSEVMFYALDLDSGQEVPFVFLKDRYLESFRTRGPGPGTVLSEPVNLADEGSEQLFPSLVAATSPSGLVGTKTVRLPFGGKYGGEVHRFGSSLFAGQSVAADAVSAGAEQIIYVTGQAAESTEAGPFSTLSAAALRQQLERDLRWADVQSDLPFFVVRPEKARLKLFEFEGRRLLDGKMLHWSTLVAHGERDALRLFVEPIIGDGFVSPPQPEIPNAVAEAADGPREWS